MRPSSYEELARTPTRSPLHGGTRPSAYQLGYTDTGIPHCGWLYSYLYPESSTWLAIDLLQGYLVERSYSVPFLHDHTSTGDMEPGVPLTSGDPELAGRSSAQALWRAGPASLSSIPGGELNWVEQADQRDVEGLKRLLLEGTPLIVSLPDQPGSAGHTSGWVTLTLIGYDDRDRTFRALGPPWWSSERWFNNPDDARYSVGSLAYEAVANEADAVLIGLRTGSRDPSGRWVQHRYREVAWEDQAVHVAWDFELELDRRGLGLAGRLHVVRTWTHSVGAVLRARVTESSSYQVAGPSGRDRLALEGAGESRVMRLLRGGAEEPLVHVARWEQDSVAPDWKEAAQLLSTFGSGLPEAASKLLPVASPAVGVGILARIGTYEGSLVTVFNGAGLPGEVVDLRRPIADLHAHVGTYHDHGGVVSYPALVDTRRGVYWLDRGRGECLRPVHGNVPSVSAARGEASFLLWPEGLPLLEPVELVRGRGELWLLDSGLRRPVTPGGMRDLGLDPDRARAVTDAELDAYPRGPAVE